MHRLARRNIWILAVSTVVFAGACALFGGSAPEILNHPVPPMPAAPALQDFDDTACPLENGVQRCPPESKLGAMGCERIRAPGDVLAGLKPALPMRVCLARLTGAPQKEYLFREGCLMSYAVRYVVDRGGELQLIESASDLQAIYAPVETEIEALSYALAATGLGVRYDLLPEAGLRYFVDDLQDTFVRRIERGYLVHLFDYQVCGCGPHPTSTVDLLVTIDGQIEELQRTKVFEDPAEDNLCVD